MRRLVKLRDRFVIWNVTTDAPASGLLTRSEVWQHAREFFGDVTPGSDSHANVFRMITYAAHYGCSTKESVLEATGFTVDQLLARVSPTESRTSSTPTPIDQRAPSECVSRSSVPRAA